MKRRKARTVCICGQPMPYGWMWGHRWGRKCPHGYRRIGFMGRGSWRSWEDLDGTVEWYRDRPYRTELIRPDWRKKRRRLHAKRAGVRRKMRAKRG